MIYLISNDSVDKTLIRLEANIGYMDRDKCLSQVPLVWLTNCQRYYQSRSSYSINLSLTDTFTLSIAGYDPIIKLR